MEMKRAEMKEAWRVETMDSTAAMMVVVKDEMSVVLLAAKKAGMMAWKMGENMAVEWVGKMDI